MNTSSDSYRAAANDDAEGSMQTPELQRASFNKNDINNYSVPQNLGPIQTFVFVDLETSGLDYPKITEISMMAVSRDDLILMETRSRKTKHLNVNKGNTSRKDSLIGRVDANSSVTQKMERTSVKENSSRRRLFTTPLKKRKVDCEDEQNEKMIKLDFEVSQLNQIQSSNSQLQDKLVENNEHRGCSHLNNTLKAQCVDAVTQTYHKNRVIYNLYDIPNLPRIVHRSTKFFNPKRIIYTVVEEISGLNNIMLEQYPVVTPEYIRSFKDFLDLPKPVCLIGHNADRCDFPTIIAEFIYATDCQFDCGDILCADSLTALKYLDKIEIFEEIQAISIIVADNINWFLREDVFFDDMDTSCDDKIEDINVDEVGPSHQIHLTPVRSIHSGLNHSSTLTHYKTPVKSINVNGSQAPETPETPGSQSASRCARTPVRSVSLDTPSKSPTTRPTNSTTLPDDKRLVKYPRNCSFKSKICITKHNTDYNLGFSTSSAPFSQPTLYRRLFGTDYDSHRAEADCKALLEICGHYGDKFTDAIDVIKKPLRLVKPKWFKNKTVNSINYRKYWLENVERNYLTSNNRG